MHSNEMCEIKMSNSIIVVVARNIGIIDATLVRYLTKVWMNCSRLLMIIEGSVLS